MHGVTLGALLFPLALTSTVLHAQSSSRPADTLSPVVLRDAHTFVSRDSSSGIHYRLYVALPASYSSSSQRYPVLYVLDADAAFAMVTQVYRILGVESAMPELIIAGIGYDLTGAARRTRRIQDLTPTTIRADSATGGSGVFLNYLAGTVVPAIDSLYRTDVTDRSIFGHSLGGLFALFALFERPDLFRRYIISSPSLWWDNGAVLEMERRFAHAPQSLQGRSVFLSVGTDEPLDMRERFRPLVDSLRSRQYPHFTIEAAELAGETHLSAFATGFVRGLRVIYH